MKATKNFFKEKKPWSIVKDNVLNYYLTPYISKIATSPKNTVLVDCFAGAGRFDDGNDGSPRIICNHVMNSHYPNKFKVICVEKYTKYYNKLTNAVAEYGDLCTTYNDSFENCLSRILCNCYDKNVFFYIDPFGIKSLNFDIFNNISHFSLKGYEVLMNFNSFGFLREGCRLLNFEYDKNDFPDLDELYDTYYDIDQLYLDDIAGGKYWRDILEDYHSGLCTMSEAEDKLVKKYTNVLNNKHIFKYIINIPIRTKESNIPKYRLIFGTNHFEALCIMWDNMYKNLEQKKINDNNGQLSLENTHPILTHYTYYSNELQDYIILNLSDSNFLNLEVLWYKIIRKFNIKYSKQKCEDILRGLIKDNFIEPYYENLTPKGKKPTSLSTKNYKILLKLTQRGILYQTNIRYNKDINL